MAKKKYTLKLRKAVTINGESYGPGEVVTEDPELAGELSRIARDAEETRSDKARPTEKVANARKARNEKEAAQAKKAGKAKK